jgi:hypothetical protein
MTITDLTFAQIAHVIAETRPTDDHRRCVDYGHVFVIKKIIAWIVMSMATRVDFVTGRVNPSTDIIVRTETAPQRIHAYWRQLTSCNWHEARSIMWIADGAQITISGHVFCTEAARVFLTLGLNSDLPLYCA